jgi:hypothetical protein
MSRKGKGDFELSTLQLGYWNRPRDAARSVEIDLVALDEGNRRVRFGSCKRSALAHDRTATTTFEGHVEVFLQAQQHRRLRDWRHEKVLFAPQFSEDQRAALSDRGFNCMDLYDCRKML